MGREVRRVPIDFDHPIREVWPGFRRSCGEGECPDDCAGCAKVEPPAGEGWQCWETVTDGSPISPVFTSRDALLRWLVTEEDCAPEAADAFIERGWAPSMMGTPFGVFKGVQFAAGVEAAIEWQYVKAGDYSTIAKGAPIRHLETGIAGRVNHRFPPPNGDYYFVTWEQGLPSLLAENPQADPAASMDAVCRLDGFELIAEVS